MKKKKLLCYHTHSQKAHFTWGVIMDIKGESRGQRSCGKALLTSKRGALFSPTIHAQCASPKVFAMQIPHDLQTHTQSPACTVCAARLLSDAGPRRAYYTSHLQRQRTRCCFNNYTTQQLFIFCFIVLKRSFIVFLVFNSKF